MARGILRRKGQKAPPGLDFRARSVRKGGTGVGRQDDRIPATPADGADPLRTDCAAGGIRSPAAPAVGALRPHGSDGGCCRPFVMPGPTVTLMVQPASAAENRSHGAILPHAVPDGAIAGRPCRQVPAPLAGCPLRQQTENRKPARPLRGIQTGQSPPSGYSDGAEPPFGVFRRGRAPARRFSISEKPPYPNERPGERPVTRPVTECKTKKSGERICQGENFSFP